MIVSVVQGTAVIAAYDLTDGMVISDDGSQATLGDVMFHAPEGCFLVALAEGATTGLPGDLYDPATKTFSPPPDEDYAP